MYHYWYCSPCYYRVIRLLRVGPSVQPSLITLFLEENENEFYKGTHIEQKSACTVPPTPGEWGVLVRGGWEHGCRESCPGPPCSQCISEVWILLLVLLCNIVQLFAWSYTQRTNRGSLYFSFRSKNIPFPLGVWDQQKKLLMVQSFVSTRARKAKGL